MQEAAEDQGPCVCRGCAARCNGCGAGAIASLKRENMSTTKLSVRRLLYKGAPCRRRRVDSKHKGEEDRNANRTRPLIDLSKRQGLYALLALPFRASNPKSPTRADSK